MPQQQLFQLKLQLKQPQFELFELVQPVEFFKLQQQLVAQQQLIVKLVLVPLVVLVEFLVEFVKQLVFEQFVEQLQPVLVKQQFLIVLVEQF